MIDAIRHAVMYAGAALLVLISSAVTLAAMGRAARSARNRLRGSVALFAALALASMIYGRKGRVTVSDPYVADAGSYLTNDIAHVELSRRTPLLPDDTEILVYARQVDQTNATDWVRLTPHLTFADHPFDYVLLNATNHDVMVAADFTPAPTVHTNGVWQVKGFTIPGTGRSVFPNTKVITKEAP